MGAYRTGPTVSDRGLKSVPGPVFEVLLSSSLRLRVRGEEGHESEETLGSRGRSDRDCSLYKTGDRTVGRVVRPNLPCKVLPS